MELKEKVNSEEALLGDIDRQIIEIIRMEQQKVKEACVQLTQPKDPDTTQEIIKGAQAFADQLLTKTAYRVKLTESNLPLFLKNLQNVLLMPTETQPEQIGAKVETSVTQAGRRTTNVIDWGRPKEDPYGRFIAPQDGINLLIHFGLLDGVRGNIPYDHPDADHHFAMVAREYWKEITNLPERMSPFGPRSST